MQPNRHSAQHSENARAHRTMHARDTGTAPACSGSPSHGESRTPTRRVRLARGGGAPAWCACWDAVHRFRTSDTAVHHVHMRGTMRHAGHAHTTPGDAAGRLRVPGECGKVVASGEGGLRSRLRKTMHTSTHTVRTAGVTHRRGGGGGEGWRPAEVRGVCGRSPGARCGEARQPPL
jgi:hypothetical protein